LFVELTPFQFIPSGDIIITNQADEVVSSTSFNFFTHLSSMIILPSP